jgi:hypothetical protein
VCFVRRRAQESTGCCYWEVLSEKIGLLEAFVEPAGARLEMTSSALGRQGRSSRPQEQQQILVAVDRYNAVLVGALFEEGPRFDVVAAFLELVLSYVQKCLVVGPWGLREAPQRTSEQPMPLVAFLPHLEVALLEVRVDQRSGSLR